MAAPAAGDRCRPRASRPPLTRGSSLNHNPFSLSIVIACTPSQPPNPRQLAQRSPRTARPVPPRRQRQAAAQRRNVDQHRQHVLALPVSSFVHCLTIERPPPPHIRLYLESPAGVGFSYSKNSSDYTVGDERTADDTYVTSFPRCLFVTSCAGTSSCRVSTRNSLSLQATTSGSRARATEAITSPTPPPASSGGTSKSKARTSTSKVSWSATPGPTPPSTTAVQSTTGSSTAWCPPPRTSPPSPTVFV